MGQKFKASDTAANLEGKPLDHPDGVRVFVDLIADFLELAAVVRSTIVVQDWGVSYQDVQGTVFQPHYPVFQVVQTILAHVLPQQFVCFLNVELSRRRSWHSYFLTQQLKQTQPIAN